MNKSKIYILIDDIFKNYENQFGDIGETILVDEFKKYFADLSQKSEIMIITRQDITKINNWLLKHNLLVFVSDVSKPII